MPDLSLQHIDQISRDISREEISFSHLLEDLIDHICCDVEYEMQNGKNFTEAYKTVKEKMGPRRLKEIQEETLYAVDTKYRYMKKTMKISGVIGTIMLGFGVIFKIQHFPMAGVLLTLGALLLAFVFLPSALGVLWKETHSRKKLFLYISAFLAGTCFIGGTLFKVQHWDGASQILFLGTLSGIFFFIPALLVNRMNEPESKNKRLVYILGAAGSVLFITGVLFKIQHWPLATLFILTGIFLLSFLVFPMFTRLTWKEESHVSSMFIFMVIGFVLIIIPGAMLTLSLQHSYQAYYYPNNDQQNALYDYLSAKNSSLISRYNNSLNYSSMEQLHSKTTGILNIIGNIEEKMVQESESKSGGSDISAVPLTQINTGQKIIYRNLSKPFDRQPVKVFLLPGCNARMELNSSIADYIGYLTGMTSAENLSKYKNLLETEKFLPAGNPGEGEVSLMAGLHSLEILKNEILTVESCILNDIAKH